MLCNEPRATLRYSSLIFDPQPTQRWIEGADQRRRRKHQEPDQLARHGVPADGLDRAHLRQVNAVDDRLQRHGQVEQHERRAADEQRLERASSLRTACRRLPTTECGARAASTISEVTMATSSTARIRPPRSTTGTTNSAHSSCCPTWASAGMSARSKPRIVSLQAATTEVSTAAAKESPTAHCISEP